MRIERLVPGLQLPLSFLVCCDFVATHPPQLLPLFQRSWLIGRNQVVQQLVDTSHAARHAVLQHVVGVGLAAQQLGRLAAQVNKSLADIEVVLRVVVNTHRVARHVHLLAQLTLCRVCHERRVRGHVECKHPALQTALLRRLCSRLARRLGQSVELGLVGQVQRISLLLLQQVLLELQPQHRSLLRQLAQPLLSRLVEQGAATHEPVVARVEQHLLLGRQPAVVAVYVLDAFKQPLVQADVVGMLRQNRRHLLRQRVHVVVRLSRQQVEEHSRRASQQVVVVVLLVVHRDDCVIERWLLRVVDNLVYLLVIAAYALHEGFLEVLQADTVKRRRVVRRIVRLKKRILPLILLIHNNNFLYNSVQRYKEKPKAQNFRQNIITLQRYAGRSQ